MLQDLNYIRTGYRLSRSFVWSGTALGIVSGHSGVLNSVLMRDGAHCLVLRVVQGSGWVSIWPLAVSWTFAIRYPVRTDFSNRDGVITTDVSVRSRE